MPKKVVPHGQPKSLFVGHASETVSEIQNESPIISQQQIQPINLKYSPIVNLRIYSFFASGIGLILLIIYVNSALSNYSVDDFRWGNILCLSFFAIACFLDASYSKGKSDWELSIGQSNSKSTIGMIFNTIIGILCIFIVVFVFIPMH
jgi:hypothetical protein